MGEGLSTLHTHLLSRSSIILVRMRLYPSRWRILRPQLAHSEDRGPFVRVGKFQKRTARMEGTPREDRLDQLLVERTAVPQADVDQRPGDSEVRGRPARPAPGPDRRPLRRLAVADAGRADRAHISARRRRAARQLEVYRFGSESPTKLDWFLDNAVLLLGAGRYALLFGTRRVRPRLTRNPRVFPPRYGRRSSVCRFLFLGRKGLHKKKSPNKIVSRSHVGSSGL